MLQRLKKRNETHLISRRGSVERGRKASPIAAEIALVKRPMAITILLMFLGAFVLQSGDVSALVRHENRKASSLQSIFEGGDGSEDLGESDEDYARNKVKMGPRILRATEKEGLAHCR